MVHPTEFEQEIEASLQESIQAYCQKIANELAESDNQLIDPKEKALKLEKELFDEIKQYKKRLSHGFKICLDTLEGLATIDRSIDYDSCKEEIAQAFEKLSTKNNVKALAKKVSEGKSWCEALKISDHSLELLYKAAENIFTIKRYEEAVSAFSFLATIDSMQYAFWIGLGHAYFHLAQFNEAINAYRTAALCDPFSCWPHFYIANCFEHEKDFDQALIALDDAKNAYIQSETDDKELLNVIEARIKMVTK